MSCDPEQVEEALELCDQILSDCVDIPEGGENYASSVEQTVSDIRAWIDENQHVTKKQLKALNNMAEGLSKWQE